jgi:hypothetical protein
LRTLAPSAVVDEMPLRDDGPTAKARAVVAAGASATRAAGEKARAVDARARGSAALAKFIITFECTARFGTGLSSIVPICIFRGEDEGEG